MSRAENYFTSQETHYVSTTEFNLLMLFKETAAVYWESERGKWGGSEKNCRVGGG
jgi:hypothetical protein